MNAQSYRGYIIEPVFDYLSRFGKYDFEFHCENDPEDNGLAHYATLEQVKAMIDERIEESTLTI